MAGSQPLFCMLLCSKAHATLWCTLKAKEHMLPRVAPEQPNQADRGSSCC